MAGYYAVLAVLLYFFVFFFFFGGGGGGGGGGGKTINLFYCKSGPFVIYNLYTSCFLFFLIVIYCDNLMSFLSRVTSDMRCPSSTIASNDISSKTTGLVLTKLGRSDPYMAFFQNCSDDSSPLHI